MESLKPKHRKTRVITNIRREKESIPFINYGKQWLVSFRWTQLIYHFQYKVNQFIYIFIHKLYVYLRFNIAYLMLYICVCVCVCVCVFVYVCVKYSIPV